MTAIRKQTLDEILRILRKEIAWDVEDGDTCTPIDPEAIVFRKIAGERDINSGRTMERLPGIFVSCPFTEPIPEEAGENAHDEYRWMFLCQICDRDNYGPDENIGTYCIWQEKMCRKLHFKCLDNIDAFRSISTARSVNVVDEKYWVKEEMFKAGIVITVRVWMARVSDDTRI